MKTGKSAEIPFKFCQIHKFISPHTPSSSNVMALRGISWIGLFQFFRGRAFLSDFNKDWETEDFEEVLLPLPRKTEESTIYIYTLINFFETYSHPQLSEVNGVSVW